MTQWRSTTLGELVSETGGSLKTGPFGTTLKAAEYSTVGVPIVSVGEVGFGRLNASESTPRAGSDIVAQLPEYLLDPGDLVFGRKGAVNRSAIVLPDQAGWFLGSDGIRARFGEGVDSKFVSYQLQLSELRDWLVQHASGSTLLSLNQATLSRVPLRLPSIPVQRAVVEVLGALDDKIAANTKLAQTADELAKQNFKSAIQDSVEEVPLSSTAEFINGKAFTKGATGTGRVVVRIAELNSGLTGSTVRNDLDVADKHLARAGDILFAWSGSLTLHRWFREEAIVNQHIFKVIPHENHPRWLIYQLVEEKLEEFQRVAADKATTMGHIQRRHLDESVATPSPEKVTGMHELMDGLWDRALAAKVENELLAQLRSTLLPQLMSGKLSVKDAEAVVSEAI